MKNIMFVSLIPFYTYDIAKRFSDITDRYFLDVSSLIQYELINEKQVYVTVGAEYLKKLEYKIIKSVAEYEGVGALIKFADLFGSGNLEVLDKRYVIIYLRFSKKKSEELIKEFHNSDAALKNSIIPFKEKDEICKSRSEFVIEITNDDIDKHVEKIVKMVEEKYGK